MFNLLILIFFLLIIFIILMILYKSCNKTEIITLKVTKKPIILLLAGIHGNEPAGSFFLNKLIKTLKPKKGTIIIMPKINWCGLAINSRYQPPFFVDINRNLPITLSNNNNSNLLSNYINIADYIIDFHEGWGFYKLNNKSFGSGIYPGRTKKSIILARRALIKINKKIIIPFKKFIFKNMQDVPGTVKYYSDKKKKHYILIETSGQKDILPLKERIFQLNIIIKSILNDLGII